MDKNKIIDKVKELFSTEEVKMASLDAVVSKPVTIEIPDGTELADGMEIEAENGTYVLADGTSFEVSEGVVSNLVAEETSTEEMKSHRFALITAVSKYEVEVDAETFEVGSQLRQVDTEGNSWSLDDGEYELEDGRSIQVDSEGIVVLIGDGETEETSEETLMSEETKKEIEELKSKITEMEAKEVEMNSQIEKLNNEPAEVETKIEKATFSKKEIANDRLMAIRNAMKKIK